MTRTHYIILIVACILCFLGGIGTTIGVFYSRARANDFINNGVKIDATIFLIEITGAGEDTRGHAYVIYTINGMTYRTELNRYSSKMYEGQVVPIRYMPNNPNIIAYAENEYLGVILCIVASVVLLLVAAVLLIVTFVLKNRIQ